MEDHKTDCVGWDSTNRRMRDRQFREDSSGGGTGQTTGMYERTQQAEGLGKDDIGEDSPTGTHAFGEDSSDGEIIEEKTHLALDRGSEDRSYRKGQMT
jgi:hypothetical protein